MSSRLEKRLKNWVSNNLISPQQADSILTYESNQPGSSWILSGLLILGVIVIGTGIISVIAANWHKIPDVLKLTGNFFWLGAVAYGIFYCWKNEKKIATEVLIIFFMLQCMASIGLISQIYHVNGKLYQALLLWSLITCAIAANAKTIFTPMSWLITFICTLSFAAVESPSTEMLFRHNESSLFMAIPLFCATLTVLCKTLSDESPFTRSARVCALVSGLIGIVTAEIFGNNYIRDRIELLSPAFWPAYAFLVITLISIIRNKQYQSIQRILLLCTVGFYAFLFALPKLYLDSDVTYAIISIISLSCMTVFLATIQQRKLFHMLLFIVGIRFIVLYFQAFGGLATTGLGLIISGTFIIGMAILWNKYKVALAVWAEKWGR